MRWKQIVRLKMRSLLSRDAVEQELDEELRYHFEREIARNLAAGLSAQEARYSALRSMGAMEQRKEECRDSRGIGWLQDLVQDVRYALRTLSKTPGFTVVAVLVLALGIGANTAVFTVVNGVLLRPLPYPEADRLFLLSIVPKDLFFDPGSIMTDPDYREFRTHNHSFESLATIGSTGSNTVTMTKQGEPVAVKASEISGDLLPVLRVQPAVGRAFLHEGQPDSNVVLLSSHLWMNRFHGDSQAVGKAVTLDGVSYTVVGVMPASFTFQNADLWMRYEVRPQNNNVFLLPVIGRLRSGVSPAQAKAELAAFRRDAASTRLLPLKDLFVAGVRSLLLMFSGAVGFVFLIVCANFANLLLIRGAGRQPEIAVRAALGASRWRIVRQLITESTLLSLAGAGLGLMLSAFGVHALMAMLPPDKVAAGELHTDNWVLLFAVALALVTGLIFGLVPALQATRRSLRDGVNEGGRSVLVRRERLRGALVTAEIALALMLLTGSGLLVKSFLQMRAVNPGFQSSNLTVAHVDLPRSRYKTALQIKIFNDQVLSALSQLPGVQSAAAVSFLPFGSGVRGTFYLEDGRQMRDEYRVDKPEISADYFRTMGIRIVSGRGFTERDNAGTPGVAVLSESVARKFWPAGHAVGQRISMEEHPKAEDWLTVVGVAGDVRQQGLTDKSGTVIYQPYAQIKQPGFIQDMNFVAKSESAATVAVSMRAIIRRLDQDLLTESITSMDSIVSDSMSGARSQTRLLGIFSIAALLLAAIGIYGVLACSVAERTHEIGIRMAVGAGQKDIVWMVMRRTMLLTGSGAIIGIFGALGVTRVLTKFLFEVTPTDPSVFVAVTIILIGVALLSACIPAQRAARVHPLEALRHE